MKTIKFLIFVFFLISPTLFADTETVTTEHFDDAGNFTGVTSVSTYDDGTVRTATRNETADPEYREEWKYPDGRSEVEEHKQDGSGHRTETEADGSWSRVEWDAEHKIFTTTDSSGAEIEIRDLNQQTMKTIWPDRGDETDEIKYHEEISRLDEDGEEGDTLWRDTIYRDGTRVKWKRHEDDTYTITNLKWDEENEKWVIQEWVRYRGMTELERGKGDPESEEEDEEEDEEDLDQIDDPEAEEEEQEDEHENN